MKFIQHFDDEKKSIDGKFLLVKCVHEINVKAYESLAPLGLSAPTICTFCICLLISDGI